MTLYLVIYKNGRRTVTADTAMPMIRREFRRDGFWTAFDTFYCSIVHIMYLGEI